MVQIYIKDIRSMREFPMERPVWVEEKRWNRIQKIKGNEDKKRSLASAYLLNVMCNEFNIDNPVYAYTDREKPFLPNTDCAFNISHSGDYVALACHAGVDSIGVDIQQLHMMREGMEKRILHEKEILPVFKCEDDRRDYLNRLWTVKESFVKMTGEGLARDFRTIYVDFVSSTVSAEPDVQANFSVWKWKEEYYLAVCSVNKEKYEIKEL